ncbi:MAG: hypothetical protein JWO37_3624 [Acidimicrobiales bacterium]|nr:hypothetical protein [Acidimicrobiales bacterium]
MPTRAVLSPDGADFVRVSRQSIFGSGFWAGTRAPVLPLMLRVLGNKVSTVAVANGVIGAVCWGALAFAAASRLRTRAGQAAVFAGVLLVAGSLQVSVWHGVVLAESLSLSLMAALLALVLVVPARWSWPGVAGVAAMGALFVLVRDTNALVGLLLAAIVVAGVAWRRVPLRALVAAAVLVAASLAGMASSSAGDRWLQGLHHVTRDRILASDSGRDWFVARGLPDADLVRSPDGNDYTRGAAFWSDPRLAPYLRWLRRHGRAALATYVLAHPAFLGQGRFAAWSSTFGPRPTLRVYTAYTDSRAPLGSFVNGIVWPESAPVVFPLLLVGMAAGAGAVVFDVDRRRRTFAALGLAGIVVGLGWAVATANLDTAETPRHVIAQLALARLGVLFCVVAATEAGLALARGRKPGTIPGLPPRAAHAGGSSRSSDSASGPADPGTSTPPPSTRTANPPASSSAGS